MGLLSFLPSIFAVVGSLFKGKKQQYTPQQSQQRAAAYNALLQMIQRQIGQPSAGMQAGNDAMNILYSTFLGRPYQPTSNFGGQVPVGTGGQVTRRSLQQP